jgi:hypothetical protein
MTDQALALETDDDERRRRGLLWLWLGIVVVLLAGLFAAIQGHDGCSSPRCPSIAGGSTRVVGGNDDGSDTGSTGFAASTKARSASAVAASIRVFGQERGGLAPGVTSPVLVTVTNTGDKPARVTSAHVVVGDASGSCTAADSIRVTHYDAAVPGAKRYDIAPGAAAHIPLSISMLDLASNQNACKNASFPLTFQASARQG